MTAEIRRGDDPVRYSHFSAASGAATDDRAESPDFSISNAELHHNDALSDAETAIDHASSTDLIPQNPDLFSLNDEVPTSDATYQTDPVINNADLILTENDPEGVYIVSVTYGTSTLGDPASSTLASRKRTFSEKERGDTSSSLITVPISDTHPLYTTMCRVNLLLNSDPSNSIVTELSRILVSYVHIDTIRRRVFSYLRRISRSDCPSKSCNPCDCILFSMAEQKCISFSHDLICLIRILRSRVVNLRQGKEFLSTINSRTIIAMTSSIVDYVIGETVECAHRRPHSFLCEVIRHDSNYFRLSCLALRPEGILARDIERIKSQYMRFRANDEVPDRARQCDNYLDQIGDIARKYAADVSSLMQDNCFQ